MLSSVGYSEMPLWINGRCFEWTYNETEHTIQMFIFVREGEGLAVKLYGKGIN